jgi:uncharacterized protein
VVQVERKTRQFKAEDVSANGSIRGYASVFNVVDSYGDIVAPGAFTDTLADHKAKGTFPKFLSEHRSGQFLGDWSDMREDDKGLWVEGQFDLSTPLAKEAHHHAMAGRLDGLSIGFSTVERKYNEETWERTLLKLRLFEVSLVTFPANADARVDAVKAANLTDRDFEEMLTRDAGLSRTVARALMRGGLAELRAKQDAGPDIEASRLASAIRQGLKSGMPDAAETRAIPSRIADALRAEITSIRS